MSGSRQQNVTFYISPWKGSRYQGLKPSNFKEDI